MKDINEMYAKGSVGEYTLNLKDGRNISLDCLQEDEIWTHKNKTFLRMRMPVIDIDLLDSLLNTKSKIKGTITGEYLLVSNIAGRDKEYKVDFKIKKLHGFYIYEKENGSYYVVDLIFQVK